MKDKAWYIPVLGYHEISNDQWYYNTPEQFEAHIRYLAENGYKSISMKDYIDYWKGTISEADLPEKPVLITFDDAREGVYRYAYPILKQYGMPFTLFVIGKSLNQPDFLTYDQVKEMIASGLCTIGSHSYDSHFFDLADANGTNESRFAVRVWQDAGIYAYLNKGEHYKTSQYWALPIAGTGADLNGDLFRIESYVGFYADKTMEIDRALIKFATHIPVETYYELHVTVGIGEKIDATTTLNETIIAEDWEPRGEPLDLYDEGKGVSWPVGRFSVIYFDQPYQVQAGKWYNLHFITNNLGSQQAELRIYMDPSLFETENCATNSYSSDYERVDNWAIHHGLPMIILSNGNGTVESIDSFNARVTEDTNKLKRLVGEYLGSCVTVARHDAQKTIADANTPIYIPLFGASINNGNPEPVECNLMVSFSESFTAKRLLCNPGTHFGTGYVALCDIYIGDWNGGSPSNFTLIHRGFTPLQKWREVSRLEIEFEEPYYIEAGHEYCLKFVTRNTTTNELGFVEGVFRISGYHNPGSSDMTGFWNSIVTNGITAAAVNPDIWLESESSTYPVGAYEPEVWTLAFPFGAHNELLRANQSTNGMQAMFTIQASIFDTRENRNLAAVDVFDEIPRVMMLNDSLMPPFADLLRMNTFEMFWPEKPKPPVKIYAYVINREWGCHSLRENRELIDVAVFDGYNFRLDLTLTADINPDKEWWQTLGKPAYAVFGNFGENGFDPAIAAAVFDNREASIQAIINTVINDQWDGVCIDFEEVPASYRDSAVIWFQSLATMLHTGLSKYYELVVAAPFPYATNPSWEAWFNYAAIANYVDKISPMTYLDHGPWTEPGPISDFSLFRRRYNTLLQYVPHYKLAAGIGLFGTIWDEEPEEKNIIEIVTWTMSKENLIPSKNYDAQQWHVQPEQMVGEAWFSAGDTIGKQLELVHEANIRSVAMWKLDDDDFSFWKRKQHTFYYRPHFKVAKIED